MREPHQVNFRLGDAMPLPDKKFVLGSEYRDMWGKLTADGWQEKNRRKGVQSGQSRRDRVFLRDADIISALRSGQTQADVAQQFGVNQSTVSRILKRWQSRIDL